MRSFFQKLVAKKKSERDLTKSKDDDCDYAHRITDAETWNKLAHVPHGKDQLVMRDQFFNGYILNLFGWPFNANHPYKNIKYYL